MVKILFFSRKKASYMGDVERVNAPVCFSIRFFYRYAMYTYQIVMKVDSMESNGKKE